LYTSWDSTVTIVTRPQPGQSGVQFQARARDFYLLQNVQTRSGIHTAFYFTHRGGSIPGVKHLQCAVNHSLPTSAKIKNKWSYNSTPPIYIHSMDMDNFTSPLMCLCTSVIYTAATGSFCTTISCIGRLDKYGPYTHIKSHYILTQDVRKYHTKFTSVPSITSDGQKCDILLQMWVKNFPHKHISIYNMWVKKQFALLIFHRHCFKNTFLLNGRGCCTVTLS